MSAALVLLDADALIERLKTIVEDALKRHSTPPPSPLVFTTHKSGLHLPGKSRRWMLDHIRDMPGARKTGRDWEISATDFEAWKRAQDIRVVRLATARRPPKPVEVSVDLAEMELEVERSLKAGGFRRSR